MTASTLLAHLTDRGVHLGAEDGSLIVRAPRGVLTAEDRAALQTCKPELLALVAPSAAPNDEPTAAEPADWPESWAADFDVMRAENIRLGQVPGSASRLAFLVLEARAAAPWRAVVTAWSNDRRQRWGDRAGELQDAGTDWREAERIAFAEIECP